jgi:hypothetical protein
MIERDDSDRQVLEVNRAEDPGIVLWIEHLMADDADPGIVVDLP